MQIIYTHSIHVEVAVIKVMWTCVCNDGMLDGRALHPRGVRESSGATPWTASDCMFTLN
jgi:hypothetical protein